MSRIYIFNIIIRVALQNLPFLFYENLRLEVDELLEVKSFEKRLVKFRYFCVCCKT